MAGTTLYLITEGPDKGAVEMALKASMGLSDYIATETLVALKREDALKLLD